METIREVLRKDQRENYELHLNGISIPFQQRKKSTLLDQIQNQKYTLGKIEKGERYDFLEKISF